MTAAADQEDRLLTPAEAGQVLRVSAYTVRHWAREGKIPALIIGHKTIRFRRSSLEAWILEQERGG